MEERTGKGVGRTEQTRAPGAPLGKHAPFSARPSGAGSQSAAAGPAPLARKQKHPAVEKVALARRQSSGSQLG